MRVRAHRRGIDLAILSATFWGLSGVLAVDYSDFPTDLQQILDERIADLNAEGGVCVAGKVTMSDGSLITGGAAVMVNLYDGADKPLWVYEDGWCIMRATMAPHYAGPEKRFAVRAFGYDPIDPLVTILAGEITYADFELVKTPPADLASVSGVVWDENGQPFNGAYVSISFPFANFGTNNSPRMGGAVGVDGEYIFSGLSVAEHSVVASEAGYAYHKRYFTPPAGGNAVEDRRLYPNRRITIEYVYQPDGTRSLLGENAETGIINWLNGTGGVDFSDGVVEGYEPEDLRDLEMRQTQDILEFRVFYGNGWNGFYDAGAVDFESLVEADTSGYLSRTLPVQVGHVYVVRTYEEDNYAKFIVKTDEASFRTVVPGDPDPIEFAGYGLTIDFTYSSGYSQVAVEKHFDDVPVIGEDALPYVLDVSGMAGVTFSADLVMAYDEADVIARRLSEQDLTLLQSTDDGNSWSELGAMLDSVDNTLTAEGLTWFGLFAVADLSSRFPGDMDRDGDIDLADFRHFQRCFTGSEGSQTDPSCVGALMDIDSDVDEADFEAFHGCISGPNMPGDPACAG